MKDLRHRGGDGNQPPRAVARREHSTNSLKGQPKTGSYSLSGLCATTEGESFDRERRPAKSSRKNAERNCLSPMEFRRQWPLAGGFSSQLRRQKSRGARGPGGARQRRPAALPPAKNVIGQGQFTRRSRTAAAGIQVCGLGNAGTDCTEDLRELQGPGTIRLDVISGSKACCYDPKEPAGPRLTG